MIYVMSDIHGYIDLLKERVGQILPRLRKEDKIIFLGDYIDVGTQSRQTLEFLRSLQSEYPENVIVLKGNHEQWFLDSILDRGWDDWFMSDEGMATSRTFMTEEQLAECRSKLSNGGRSAYYTYMRNRIRDNYPDLLKWTDALPLYYETETQIFVHAGVDEDAGERWKTATDEHTLMNKYPAQLGMFCKDIIAGHIGTAVIAGDWDFHGIFHDGMSHFYIDSTVQKSGFLNVLAYSEIRGKYYSLGIDGQLEPVKKYEFYV